MDSKGLCDQDELLFPLKTFEEFRWRLISIHDEEDSITGLTHGMALVICVAELTTVLDGIGDAAHALLQAHDYRKPLHRVIRRDVI